ncbi:MAG: zinc ribbon domain-containing protein [Acidobacteria bacterium]|nr:zinc ribbon domain-containing protein [Acidobacteriota bacterium]
MPIFEYACKDCAHRFEAFVQGGAQAQCPACQSTNLEQQLSVFAVGGRSERLAPNLRGEPAGPCGTCGDPRGPGSCSIN